MPFDADDDEDAPVGGAPLPPDDRLWRHPSELGPSLPAPSGSVTSGTKTWAVAVVAGLLGSALSLGFVAVYTGFGTDVIEKPVVEKVAVRPMSDIGGGPISSSGPSVMTIAKSVSPAITRIEVDDGKGGGSGILVRDDGYVVTNAHVVDKARTIDVVLADGTSLPARVVGNDPLTDIAVVKVDRDHLPVAVLGSAIDLESGQPAIAIGSPLGQLGGPSVTVGVISGVGRRVKGVEGTELYDLIQTDAPIANGSSGGALCDGSGSVVGMTTEVGDDPSASGLSFAIPVDIVRGVVDDIIATGSARHAWLGLEGADLDNLVASQTGVAGGAKVTKVVDDSPAARAGLQTDDVITSIDGTKVTSMSSFVVALRAHHPGDVITIEIMRGSDAQTMAVTLAEKNHA